jgi:SAM-dependent methyltransferase
MTFEASADVYDRHVGRYTPALSAALIGAVGIESPATAVDVGCGPGGLAHALAQRLGAGQVAAVDPSASFVAACRERVPGGDVRLGSAEKLPFEDDAFDAVFAQLVVNFLADPEAGVREMRRVTRPGGVVAACVWDYSGGMGMLRVFWDSALELDPAAPDEGATMRFCRVGELAELWRRFGLGEVKDGALDVEASYSDFDDYWSPFPTGLAPSGAYCASLDPEGQEALREACRRRLGDPKGPFSLTARAWYAVGRA